MLAPQEGFQQAVLSTSADIAIVGSGAGVGKTFCLELEPTRHYQNPNFGATFFRRTTPQIIAQGGLWDTSLKIYPLIGGTPRRSTLEWVFPSGARIKFAHLEYEQDVHNYQGSQIPLIIFDELTQFTSYMFWYMVSRNRSDCGVKPYIRASCNPDPTSWVAELVEWWINKDTGFPIPERSGVIRYFTRDGDRIVWGDTRAEVVKQCPHIFNNPALIASGVNVEEMVKSFTFIAGSIYENKIFIQQDPSYLGTLLSLMPEEKARLLEGNWKISMDGLRLCEWEKIDQIFDNHPERSDQPVRCITVDAARFGRDLAVIYVWKGWEVIFTVIYKISDAHDLNDRIEKLRARFSVMRDMVVIDADGVGDGTLKLGSYTAFHGGHPAMYEPEVHDRSNRAANLLRYYNLKAQCMYRFAQKRVNTGQLRLSMNSQTVEIHDGTFAGGQLTLNIKMGSKVLDVREMVKAELRTWKRKEVADSVDKKQVSTKEEQKNTLGRSPDMSDALLMREFVELMPKRKTVTRTAG